MCRSQRACTSFFPNLVFRFALEALLYTLYTVLGTNHAYTHEPERHKKKCKQFKFIEVPFSPVRVHISRFFSTHPSFLFDAWFVMHFMCAAFVPTSVGSVRSLPLLYGCAVSHRRWPYYDCRLHSIFISYACAGIIAYIYWM